MACTGKKKATVLLKIFLLLTPLNLKQCFQYVGSIFFLCLDFNSLYGNVHLIEKFLGDHKLLKVTAAETVEEFSVLQTLSSGLGFFLMIQNNTRPFIVFTHTSNRFDFGRLV